MSAPVDPVAPLWAPTVEQVAKVVPAYTRGGFDDDSDELGGVEQGHFDEATEPTESEVEGYILAACEEVEGRAGVTIPLRCYKLATATAKWHVAMTIAAGKAPQTTDDTRSEVSQFTRNFLGSLEELVRQSRMGPVRLR